MDSTLDDVVDSGRNPIRLVLRTITLIGLVVFLVVALVGFFEREEHITTPDGLVSVDYPSSIRAGNPFDVLVSLRSPDCDVLVLSLDGAYVEIIEELIVQPQPDSEGADADGAHRWEFTGQPSWVRISGDAAAGRSPPVVGELTVECGKAYGMELRTRRVP